VRIAITGVSGLLGAHLATALRQDHDVRGIDRNDWWGDWPLTLAKGDLQKDKAFLVDTIKSIQPEVLVHCAGTANVDAAEKDPAEALDQNRGVTHRLLQAVPPSCSVVYISTDSVFSGTSKRWTEDQQPAPLNVHGKTKLAAERSVQQHARHLIVRTNFYGWSSGRKKTAAEWLHGALERQESITLFDDFFFTPIYAVDLAAILSRMVQREAFGVFHVPGRDRVSKFDFGSIMAREMNVSMRRVKKGSIKAMPLEAPRSTEISLSADKVQRFLGESMPQCEEGVRRFLADRNKPLSARFTHNA
jgi:dTDP-4-dehydrorhamnose reductase